MFKKCIAVICLSGFFVTGFCGKQKVEDPANHALVLSVQKTLSQDHLYALLLQLKASNAPLYDVLTRTMIIERLEQLKSLNKKLVTLQKREGLVSEL